VKIDQGQQKIKIVCTNQQSNLQASCQSIFSLSQHHPNQPQPQNQLICQRNSIQNLSIKQIKLKEKPETIDQ